MKIRVLSLLLLLGLGVYWGAFALDRPNRAMSSFIRLVGVGDFDAANALLREPCRFVQNESGDLNIADKEGGSIRLPKAKLPFLVSDRARLKGIGDSSMTALGPSSNGILESNPVHLYLRKQGCSISIVQVEFE